MSDEERRREPTKEHSAEPWSSREHRDTEDTPDARDDVWLERVRAVWRPEELSPGERRAFDARLEARIEAAAGRRWWSVPAWQPVTAILVAALAAWLVSAGDSPGPDPLPDPAMAARRPASLTAWEHEILNAGEAGTPATPVDDAMLPDDYRALAGLLLERGDIANGH